jgi:hypothetical protein
VFTSGADVCVLVYHMLISVLLPCSTTHSTDDVLAGWIIGATCAALGYAWAVWPLHSQQKPPENPNDYLTRAVDV